MKEFGIIIAGLLLSGVLLFLVSVYRKQVEDQIAMLLHFTFSDLFSLISEIKKERPEVYARVKKKLDDVVDMLVEVETALQEDKQQGNNNVPGDNN